MNPLEIKLSPQLRADIPSVDWWVTSRCNLACDFCYGPVPNADPLHLRGDIAAAIAASPARAVTFCGGEPLLVKKIADYAIRQRQAGKRTILNTNGELLRRRFNSVEEIPFDIVGISMDGHTEDIHRKMRGHAADHCETVAAARWLGAFGSATKLKIATVVSRVNAATISAFADLICTIKPDVWRMYQYSPWGPQNRGRLRHGIGRAEFETIVDMAADLVAPIPVSASSAQTAAGCLIVDPYGTVLRSRGEDYEALGSCLEEKIEDIWLRVPHQATIRRNKFWLNLV